MNLHEVQRSQPTPVPMEQLLDERETHIEYQKSGKKGLLKDNWREKRNTSRTMAELWKGKTIYKIKEDNVIPKGVVNSVIDHLTIVSRGNADDLFRPEAASSSKPAVAQNKPSSHKGEVGRSISKGPR